MNWILKFCRCFRNSVAASLGTGYDFYHPPRRNKLMITPVHRFQTVDCRNVSRPNVHRPNVHRSNHHQGKQTISSLTLYHNMQLIELFFFCLHLYLIFAKQRTSSYISCTSWNSHTCWSEHIVRWTSWLFRYSAIVCDFLFTKIKKLFGLEIDSTKTNNSNAFVASHICQLNWNREHWAWTRFVRQMKYWLMTGQHYQRM